MRFVLDLLQNLPGRGGGPGLSAFLQECDGSGRVRLQCEFDLVEQVEFKRSGDRRLLPLNPLFQFPAFFVETGLVGRIFAQIEAQHSLAQVEDARLHMFREMKTLRLDRAEVFPQLLELLPGGMSCQPDQSRQQDSRRGEAV